MQAISDEKLLGVQSMQSSDASISSKRLWASHIMSGLPTLFLLVDGGMKLFKPPVVVETTTQLGYRESAILGIGLVLLASTFLYLVPRTSIFGAVLLTGYLGGAVATQVRVGAVFFNTVFPVFFGALLWGGLWLRDRRLREMLPLRTAASGRAPEIPESADVYGWLCGSWDLEVLRYRGVDVGTRGLKGEVHAARVLEGRAIQDVWIMPRREGRRPDSDPTMNMYGTTLRSWDASIQAWRIAWTNPVRGHREEQVGRWNGSDILQEGLRADGTKTRWTFTEITQESFHWRGETLYLNQHGWTLEGEFLATRRRS